MGFPLRPKTIERISAAQRTPELSLLDAARIEYEAADMVARSLPTEANCKKAVGLYENFLLMLAIECGYIVPLLSDEELMEVGE